jgi:hypothetical protein
VVRSPDRTTGPTEGLQKTGETSGHANRRGRETRAERGQTRAEREPEFIAVEEMPKVAGTHDVRAFVGPLGGDTIATVWHYAGKEGRLLLDATETAAFDVKGETVKMDRMNGHCLVPLDARRITLRFLGMKPETVRNVLANAKLQMRKPVVLWLRAGDCKCVGNMVKGSQAGVRETGNLGDFVLCSGKIDRSGRPAAYCEYRVDVPRKGRWTLWARVRYPQGGDLSFGIVRPGEEVTLAGNQVLGNCGLNQAQWHWTGRGGGSNSPPPGSPIALALPAGPFVFRIYPREGGGTATTNPRLDLVCLAEDPTYMPTDADAKAALER